MKNKFLLVGALLGVLAISGCTDKKEDVKPTLSTPKQIDVVVDKGKSFIVFDEVPGAEYYNVSINGDIVTVRGNGTGKIQFDASKLIGEPKDYLIKVNAGGKNCFDSSFTDVYTYTPDRTIDAPVVTIDGTTLNWAKVADADVYEVFVDTPTSQQTYRSINNSFNFDNMLTVCGEYNFHVTAISQDGQSVSSVPSNKIMYIHTETLITPHNLKIEYDYNVNEEVLTFVSSENVDEFEININNQSFSERTNDSSYWLDSPFENVYMFRIRAYAKSKGINIDSSSLLNVKVKANSTQTYLNNSQFSRNSAYQVRSVLAKPEISVKSNGTMCELNIQSDESKFLSQFVIYLNNEEYKRVKASTTKLQIPLSVVNDKSIYVQAISNNTNCYDSNFSDSKFVDGSSLDTMAITKEGETVSWNKVVGATGYLVEISNLQYRNCVKIDNPNITSLDISSVTEPGQYSIKVIVLGQSVEGFTDLEYHKNLETPKNLLVDRDDVCLRFDSVEDADGYMLTIKNYSSQKQQYIQKTIPHLFTSSPIDISDYLIEAQDYEFKLQAIDLINKYVENSDLTEGKNFENIKTISSPTIKLVQEGEEFYLHITPRAEDAKLINNYEVWIDYVKFDGLVLENGRVRVTEHLQNAGLHNFRVKAIAIESEFVRDSNMVSIPHIVYKQLREVENINVSHITEESKYILSFDGQVMAGSYNVKILKAEDNDYDVEFSIPTSVVDISKYVTENGTYKIYVQAVARVEDEYYRNSEVSGNPYILSKGTTLQPVKNIHVIKDKAKDEINLTWDSVKNSSYYRVQVYYNANDSKVLNKTIIVPQSTNPTVNLASAQQLAVDKEGSYTIEIKAVGDTIYESSTISTGTYSHQMETVGDFERNIVFVDGNSYAYKIDNIDTLKNLLIRHYLYNSDTWRYDTFDYNLKVYCDLDLDTLSAQVDGIEEQIAAATTNVQKMNILATALLKQYKEILSYNLTFKDTAQNPTICLNEQENIYIFSYKSNINNSQKTETDSKVYGEKVDIVSKFDKRFASYKFNIDSQESIDVTTTEQLFMALQYNKQPKFVGDSAVAEAVYENARYVLRQICSDKMTDYQKVLHIYDFLTKRVAWNYEAENMLVNVGDNAQLQELYLESILYNSNNPNGLFSTVSETYGSNVQISNLDEFVGISSLSQGLAKAFVVLCSIEGIDSIKVNGRLEGKDYSWNKVYIDIEDDNVNGKQWYAVDLGLAIKGNKIDVAETEYQVSTHRYFLVRDNQIKATEITYHNRLGDISYEAKTDFDYYTHQSYQSEYKGIEYANNMTIDNGGNIKDLIKHAMIYAKNRKVVIDVDAKSYLDKLKTGGQLNINTVKSQINDIHLSAMTDLQDFVYNLTFTVVEERYIIFAFEPFV